MDAAPLSSKLPAAVESPLLAAAGFRHAFFTRHGGASSGPFASLNFSFGVGDDPRAVELNFQRAAASLGVAAERLCHLSQVHGATVVQLTEGARRLSTAAVEGDAVITTSSDTAAAVRTADCVPVLVGDRRLGSAAAIHAGWRGVVARVVEAAVAALVAGGSRPRDLAAAVGPHISASAFEVGDDVATELAGASDATGVIHRRVGGRPRVDLRSIVHAQLLRAGLSPSSVDHVPGCTYHDRESFFSFRRDGQMGGRHLSAIVGRRP